MTECAIPPFKINRSMVPRYYVNAYNTDVALLLQKTKRYTNSVLLHAYDKTVARSQNCIRFA
jgi:hypothetical protein